MEKTMTTPSRNQVPSELPQDLKFNAGKIDEFVNSAINQYIDRFGAAHLTIAGITALARSVIEQIKSDGADAVAAIGWQELGDWVVNLTISNRDQVVWYDNAWYKYIGELQHTIAGATPEDDGGIWSETNPNGKWVNIGDAALRSELASYDIAFGDARLAVKQPFPGASARTQHDRNANTVYLSDFEYTTDISVAIQAALNYLDSVGGGRLICQSGTFDAVTTVSKTITTRIIIELNGTWIRKTQEGHTLYIVLASDTAGLEITGTGIFFGSFTENSTYASALVVLGGNGIRALSISSSVGFVGWAAGRFNAFITLNGVSEVHMNGVYIRGGSATNRTPYGILILSEYAPSLSHSYHALDIARCGECIYAYSTTSPGIEGLKFIDCDFTSAKHAVNYVHTLGTGYYPPQIEIINCHANTHSFCYKIEKALNVKIMGGLQYRGGYSQPDFPAQLTDGWVYLKNTQDNVINTSLVMAGGPIDANAVTMENCAITRVHGTLFQNTSNKAAVNIRGTCSAFFLAQDNIKTTTGGWFDESGLTSSPLTIRIENGIELTVGIAADRALVNAEVSFSAGSIDVGKCRLGGVTIVGANSGDIISSIENVRNGYEYFVICLTPGVIIQHNTGIILSGGVNFTFTSQVNVITLRAENGIMRQISKQA